MTFFCYAFGIALAGALAIAIGNAWTANHRNGVWTIGMVATVAFVALVTGALIGWALVQYLAFVSASAGGRI
ncbi:MAG TPA: hypothetical protein VIJ64_04885 [Candidatus Lustribacter sp.]